MVSGTTSEALAEAIRLREAGKKEASRELLLGLHAAAPDDPVINYQCAWTHDSLGLEAEAVPYYQRAIANGLDGDDLAGAFLGLGSTLRCLGRYDEAATVLSRGVAAFPGDRALQAFWAMAQYNVGGHQKATGTLLRLLAETSGDPGIVRYQRALRFYADRLDETWT